MAEQDVLTLEVATPGGLKLRTQCASVQAPSVNGEFGVLPGHLPLLAALKCGLLKYNADGKDHFAVIGTGFVEAEPDKILLLTEMFMQPEDVEAETARTELVEAEKRLSEFPEQYEGPEYQELQRNVDWALARLEAADIRER